MLKVDNQRKPTFKVLEKETLMILRVGPILSIVVPLNLSLLEHTCILSGADRANSTACAMSSPSRLSDKASPAAMKMKVKFKKNQHKLRDKHS
jgi:hypothetical protein